MNPPHGASPLSRIPPPLAFLAAFLAGWFLQRFLWPGARPVPAVVVVLGCILAGLGLVLAASAIGLFVTSRTTVIPHGQPAQFIVRGPYRWTRNPMYVGLSLVYTGVAASLGTWLALPLLALPLLLLSSAVIPMEEAALRARFGQAYEDYVGRVRRWV